MKKSNKPIITSTRQQKLQKLDYHAKSWSWLITWYRGFISRLQPELYKKDLTRQESNESSSTGEMESAGKLHFALRYDKEIEGLVVKVSQSSWNSPLVH